jgi:hypothetical protein
MELQGDLVHVESLFGPFGDSAGVGSRLVQVCAKHTVGTKIVVGEPVVLLGDEAQVEA